VPGKCARRLAAKRLDRGVQCASGLLCREIRAILGVASYDEVVHRDNMAMLGE